MPNYIKREKVNHEAPLIMCFMEVIEADENFGIREVVNFGSDSYECSDVEYLSNSGEYLIIEAKSHESKDAYNTRHKIFGQLLKEHGKQSHMRNRYSASITLGILIPKDITSSGKSNTKQSGYDFYRKGYADIPEKLFVGFGELTNAKYIFVCSVETRSIDVYTWAGFHRGDKPMHSVISSK